MSARETIEAYAEGRITEGQAEQDLERVAWEPTPRPTEAQQWGVEDNPPPGGNSPDWIQLVPGIAPATRSRFTAIYDRSLRRGR